MSCFVYPAQSGNLGRAALTQPRAQPSPADVQGQHPKSISYLVFSCWGSPEIDGDSIFIPGGKEGKCAVRKEPNQPQDTIPSFSDLPFQSRAAWQLTQTLHAQPWLSFPGRELPDVSSLCSQDVWEVQILSALWIIQRGRSGRTQDRQSCCPRVISNANVCTLKPSRGGRVNHFKLTEVHFANWFFLRWSSTFWKFMVCAALRPCPEHSWGCLKYRGSQWQVCCVLQTVEPAADSCWNSHGSQAWLGWV